MGTRNLTMVISNGQTKVAQYGQWDGYPDGQGLTVLNFLKNTDLSAFKTKVDTLTNWVTESELEKMYRDLGHDGSQWVNMEISNKFKALNPQLDRDMAAEVLNFINNSDKPVLLSDNSEFIKDTLFCEWAYIIDLDKKTLEVKNGAEKVYSLENLPTKEEFVNQLESTED